jgi:hypothetical protein
MPTRDSGLVEARTLACATRPLCDARALGLFTASIWRSRACLSVLDFRTFGRYGLCGFDLLIASRPNRLSLTACFHVTRPAHWGGR